VAEAQVLLVAEVSSESLPAVEHELVTGVVTRTPSGLHVEASMADGNPRDLNRDILSALRRVERRTRWRAEWTTNGTTFRFFDYVPKGDRPAGSDRRSDRACS